MNLGDYPAIRTVKPSIFQASSVQIARLAFLFLVCTTTGVPAVSIARKGAVSHLQNPPKNQNAAIANPEPYMNEPLKQLSKEIPELKGIHPAENQQQLPVILKRTGKEIDEFFDGIVDLEAHEEIEQERSSGHGSSRRASPLRDSYIIVRQVSDKDASFDEFRMDQHGNRLREEDLGRGFLVTSGFALICVEFSTGHQLDSQYKYLGDQKVGGKDTYVVAFSQLPTVDNLAITLRGPNGTEAHMFTQGVAWVDKENFHILRLRTDLLAPQADIGLDQQTTKVDFSEIRFAELPMPLWLPREVQVYVKLGKSAERMVDLEFRNVHHYSNYRRYHVSTQIVVPK
jgi:hypothetical protein